LIYGAHAPRTLAEYPLDLVRLACKACGRKGKYNKSTLIQQFGRDTRLPDLRHEIARYDCRGKFDGGCRVYFPDRIE
jgi:hypothetical protein